jgi:hypothetical protein
VVLYAELLTNEITDEEKSAKRKVAVKRLRSI